MKTENQLDKLIEEYKQDRGKHPINGCGKDFKWWVFTSINWVRIKLTKKQEKRYEKLQIKTVVSKFRR